MTAQDNVPNFADESEDGLLNVTPFPGGSDTSRTEHPKIKPSDSEPKKMRLKMNKYVVALSVLLAGLGTTVAMMGPERFGDEISTYLLPSLKSDQQQQFVFEQKFQQLESQASSAKKLAESALNSNKAQNYSILESVEAAMQNSEFNKASLNRLNENLMQLLQRVDALEQEVLMIATSGDGAGLDKVHGNMQQISQDMAVIAKDVERNTKNFGWLANRTDALEKWQKSTQPVEKSSPTSAKQESISVKGQPVVEKTPWVIKLVNFNAKFGFLSNTVTGEKLRVKPGANVPNCGQVTEMNGSNNTIVAGSCVISRG